ncbi:DUF4440 domain-containing protein [Burkholderia alba]|uniref:DUF4440 domain-containing protein n=1 Tax=Burkholderia alba TaxID=2683677 RepID=UPI002B061319|nr:DUF4440 domain-containing protein [Burkholderia alba]
MNQRNVFFDEVRDAHVEIQQWLRGEAALARLPALLARFSPAFSMISPAGAKLDFLTLTAFFAGAHGKRPGLEIVIEDLETIDGNGDRAVIAYREWQAGGAGETTARHSTAVMVRDGEGRIEWLRLHETACAG